MKKVTISLYILLLTFGIMGCGGGNSSDSIDNSPISSSFDNQELYRFYRKSNDVVHKYQMKKLDGNNHSLSSYFFDFTAKEYVVNSQDRTVFVNGQRANSEAIAYEINQQGSMVAKNAEEEIFSLSLSKSEPFSSNGFEPYRTSERLKLTGRIYDVEVDYLANYYIVDDLASKNRFDTLTQYTTTHKTTPFLGTPSNGLVFDVNGTLKEKNQDVYSTAGSYELKTIDEKEIVLLHPTNTQQYGTHTCYLLDMNYVWKADCYLKGEKEQLKFYDKEIYESVTTYLQNNFVNTEISL